MGRRHNYLRPLSDQCTHHHVITVNFTLPSPQPAIMRSHMTYFSRMLDLLRRIIKMYTTTKVWLCLIPALMLCIIFSRLYRVKYDHAVWSAIGMIIVRPSIRPSVCLSVMLCIMTWLMPCRSQSNIGHKHTHRDCFNCPKSGNFWHWIRGFGAVKMVRACMLNENYYLLNYKIRGTLQEWVNKTKIKDVHELRELFMDERDRWISASSTKSLESDERDFEVVWLQEEDSLNIRCEHFSLLTFCHVLVLKGRLSDCLLVD